MKISSNLTCLLIILMISCTEPTVLDRKWKRVSLPEFSKVIVDSISIKAVNDFPVSMLRKDNLMIIKNNKSEIIFRVFSLPKFEYIGWFGKIGKGPKEFIVPPQIRNYNGSIQLSSVGKILFIDLPEGCVNNNFKIKQEYIVPGKIHPLNEAFTLEDNKFYGIVYRGVDGGSKELVFFDYKTHTIGSTIDFPSSLHKGLPLVSFLYFKSIAVSPKNDKFAFFYYQYPLIRIFDKNTKLQNEIWVDGLAEQIKFNNLMDSKQSNLPLALGYYQKSKATEKYLYALFCNDKGTKTDSGKFAYGRELIGKPELHIFTWGGKPVLRLQLRNNVSAFELSEDERYLYCTDLNINDKVYRYDLKPCFEHSYQ